MGKNEFHEKIISLIEKMTLDEKIGQMTQYGRYDDDTETKIAEGKVGSLLNLWGAENVNKVQKIAMEETRLGIPLLIGDDVIHGFKTIFPIPLAETASWDLEGIESAARTASREATSVGINWIFAPMVDISRDPRWGRIAEGAGEDTFLGSSVAAARVKGFQSSGDNGEMTTASCPKHFVAYGAVEGGRDYNTVDISEHHLRTTHLPPFKAAIDAGAKTIMSGFTDYNSIPATGSSELINDILKKEWGFDGLLVSDWESIEEMIPHGVAKNRAEASKLAIEAGIDMDMHSACYIENLENLVDSDPSILDKINEAVYRILYVKFKLGLFDKKDIDPSEEEKVVLCKEHIEEARDMARKSIVLLKNKDVLPFKEEKNIAVIGPLADDKESPLGCWSWKGSPENVVSVFEGLKNNNPDITFTYSKGCHIDSRDTSKIADAIYTAEKADAIVLVLGEAAYMSGENHNRSNIGLPGKQLELFHALRQLNKKILVVLMNGRPLAIPEIAEGADAILETWHLGVQCGNAISDVLFGKYNPSGKLPVTFPRSVGQVPLYYNHKNTGRPKFKKYLDVEETPLYPFGFGLSYTTFAFSNLRLEDDVIDSNGSLEIKVDIKNIGNYDGEEVVQVYFRDLYSQVTRPVKELCAFEKIFLKTGEKVEVKFNIPSKQFGYFDRNMDYIIEPGEFALWVGPNSIDGLATRFFIK